MSVTTERYDVQTQRLALAALLEGIEVRRTRDGQRYEVNSDTVYSVLTRQPGDPLKRHLRLGDLYGSEFDDQVAALAAAAKELGLVYRGTVTDSDVLLVTLAERVRQWWADAEHRTKGVVRADRGAILHALVALVEHAKNLQIALDCGDTEDAAALLGGIMAELATVAHVAGLSIEGAVGEAIDWFTVTEGDTHGH